VDAVCEVVTSPFRLQFSDSSNYSLQVLLLTMAVDYPRPLAPLRFATPFIIVKELSASSSMNLSR